MSRLDSFIRRLEAQRACLDLATASLADEAGLVLELGLGNGRTFDHLRERLPGRRIMVFERELNAHAASRPADADLVLGPLETTLPGRASELAGAVALIHSDIGCGDPDIDAALARFLATILPALLTMRGVIVSDQELATPALLECPLPAGVAAGRYFIYGRGRVLRAATT